MNYHICKANPNDATAISILIHSLGLFEWLNLESIEETAERVKNHLIIGCNNESHSIYICQGEKGEILAYAAVHWIPSLILTGQEGYISELFVTSEQRGKGIGAELIAHIKTEAKQKKCARLMLLNMRNRESYRRNFYKKLGWVEREQAANFILDLQSDS